MALTPRRTRWARGDVLKAAVVLVIVMLCVWDVSMLSVVSRVPETAAMLRGNEEAPYDTMNAATAQRTLAPTPRPWFLEPESYEKDTGCDFSAAVRLFDPSQLEINCDNIHRLDLGEFLGQGFWRQVFRAQWQGREVAVKVVKEKLLDRNDILPRHVEEAAAMFPIRKEPNIVSLVGWCNSTVIVEYVPKKLDEWVFNPSEELSVRRALELARDAARGLQQLHEAPGGPFAHTDIQTRQFLVDESGKLKLNDFNRVKYTGLCMLMGRETEKCKSPVSVAKGKWRAPEEYSKQDIDERADVYSLSLVLWSLRARTKPFDGIQKDDVYVQVPQGLRPLVSAMADFPHDMQRLIQRGWDNDPAKRPTAREYAQEIDRILLNYGTA